MTAVQPTAGAQMGAEGCEQKPFCSSQKQKSEWFDTAIAGPTQHMCQNAPSHPLISGGCSSAHPRVSTSSLLKEPSPSLYQKEDVKFFLAESPSVPEHCNPGCDIGFPESGSAICWVPSPGYMQALATRQAQPDVAVRWGGF